MVPRNGSSHTDSILPPGMQEAFSEGFKFEFNEGEMKALDVLNASLLSRQELFRRQLDPRRNINDECGFPDIVTVDNYKEMWDREAVAARVVQCFSQESWQIPPSVFEDEDPEKQTEFEEAWDQLGKSLTGPRKSWHKDERGSPVWSLLSRADELSGIGSFGVILLGFADGEDLSQPVKPGKGKKLLYVSAFDESLVQVVRFYSDKRSPEYGKPEAYTIRINDLTNSDHIGSSLGAVGINTSSLNVHESRVIHLADTHHTASSNEFFAVPRMQCVFNNLLGLRKLYAGSPEMYWKGAFPGFSWESHPSLGADVKINRAKFRDQMEQFMNGLQRYTANIGGSLKTLSPIVSDPTQQINVQIDAICIKLGIPRQIFIGAGSAGIGSGKETESLTGTWTGRVSGRQENYVTPKVVVPFVDRLIWAGVLPEPEEFHVKWDDMTAPAAPVRAQVALTTVQAITSFIQGGGENAMTLGDLYTRVLGMDDETVESILDNVKEQQEQLNPDTPDEDYFPGVAPTDPDEEEEVEEGEEESEEEESEEEGGFGDTTNEGTDSDVLDFVDNVFCKTGAGGGVDPHCKAHEAQFSKFAKTDTLYTEGGKLHLEKKSGEKFIHVYQQKPKDLEGLKPENRVWLTSDGKRASKAIHESGLTPQWTAETKKGKGGEPLQVQDGNKKHKDGTPILKPVYTGKIVENPFARKNIMVNIAENPSVLHISEDAKGKIQVKMGGDKASKNAAADHGRIGELRKKEKQIVGEMRKDAKNPLLKEVAELQLLVHQTGIRSGGNETNAKFKSYGAVTLEGRHVKVKNGKISLMFVPGKSKGQEKTYEISDSETAKMLQRRAKSAGPKGTLFDTSADAARSYLKSKDGGGFKTKDLRKLRSTDLAIAAINDHIKTNGVPKTEKEYHKVVAGIADQVADNIGNTRNMQLSTYINPNSWHALRPKGVTHEYGK